MLSQTSESPDQSQRVRVEMEARGDGKTVKIRLESFEECLGWYNAASLSIPLHQLPLLEQAIQEMRASQRSEQAGGKIIPFPSPQR